jgi:hypothetical protein
MIRPTLVALLLLSLSGQCLADNGPMMRILAVDVLSSLMPKALPTRPMEKGQSVFSVAPATFKQDYDKTYTSVSGGELQTFGVYQKAKGWAGALSYSRAYSNKFGLAVVAGAMSAEGTMRQRPFGPGGTGARMPLSSQFYSGNGDDSAKVVSLNAIYDPYGNKPDFRLPIVFGLAAMQMSGSYEIPFVSDINSGSWAVGTQGVMTNKYSVVSPGYFIAIAPQFTTWLFRWSPFAFAAAPLKKLEFGTDTLNRSTGVTTSETDTSDAGTIANYGIELTFTPINLSFSYIPAPQVDSSQKIKQDVYSLRWSHKW